jgi:hypothetical protein
MNAIAMRHHPGSTSEALRWLVAGFVFGAIAVLVFHQGAWALLHSIGLTPRAAYPMQAVPPFDIPQVMSATLWGGAWGVLLAAAVHRLEGARLVLASTLFGLVLPTLAAWFIVAAIKGQPLAGGLRSQGDDRRPDRQCGLGPGNRVRTPGIRPLGPLARRSGRGRLVASALSASNRQAERRLTAYRKRA